VSHDVAPVIAAHALFAHGMRDELVIAYVQRTWRLDPQDARAAVVAARVMAVHGHGIRMAALTDR